MNIAIIGSGLTGSVAAISLAKAGCRVDLYERLSNEELINRDRTYAITHSSRKILENIGIWSAIESDLVPFQYLNVIDYEMNKKVQFIVNDLKKEDRIYSSVGWIAQHNKTMLSILEFISNIDNRYANVSINIFVFVVAYIVWSIMKATMGIRLSKEAEMKGTDVSETGVIAYSIRD